MFHAGFQAPCETFQKIALNMGMLLLLLELLTVSTAQLETVCSEYQE